MGTWMGHVLPGTFFVGFALWWIYSILYRYYKCRFTHQEDNYRNSVTFTVATFSKLPVEGIIKVIATGVGIIGEVATAFDEHGRWVHWGNAQHISMYFFFGFSGVMDVLYFYEFNLPPNLDYACAGIAFVMEYFLFAFHLHGRTPLDVMVHTFLMYTILGAAVCGGLEAAHRTSPILALGRAYVVLIQGVWFIHIAFILYPPLGMAKWDEESHEAMMFVPLAFSWYGAGALIIILITAIFVSISLRRETAVTTNLGMNIKYEKINSADNGNARFVAFDESSEEDVL